MKTTPLVSQAPRIVVGLPEDPTACFREGWAAGQIHMLERFLKKHEGIELEQGDRDAIHDLILNGRE